MVVGSVLVRELGFFFFFLSDRMDGLASGDVAEVQCCAVFFFPRVVSSHPWPFCDFSKVHTVQAVRIRLWESGMSISSCFDSFLSSFGGVSRIVLYRIVTALSRLFCLVFYQVRLGGSELGSCHLVIAFLILWMPT